MYIFFKIKIVLSANDHGCNDDCFGDVDESGDGDGHGDVYETAMTIIDGGVDAFVAC